jgi:cyanate lyase
MNARSLAAVSAVLLLALGGAGSASGHSQIVRAAPGSGSDMFITVELRYLGLSKTTLVAKLKQGQTLAQIATAQGKSPKGLVDALVGAAKVKLDAKVKAGTLKKADEASVLTKLRAQVGKLMTQSAASTKIPAVYLKPILAYLQISDQTLQQELKSGKTLAQIAVAHGKTAAGVTSAILGPIQAQLDAQVTAGKLTATDRDTLLAQAQTDVAKLVAGTA